MLISIQPSFSRYVVAANELMSSFHLVFVRQRYLFLKSIEVALHSCWEDFLMLVIKAYCIGGTCNCLILVMIFLIWHSPQFKVGSAFFLHWSPTSLWDSCFFRQLVSFGLFISFISCLVLSSWLCHVITFKIFFELHFDINVWFKQMRFFLIMWRCFM